MTRGRCTFKHLHLLRWSGSSDPLDSALVTATPGGTPLLSERRRLVPVLLSISASPSSLSVRDALFCMKAPKRL